MAQNAPARKVVVISLAVPTVPPRHAGGSLLRHIVEAYSSHGDAVIVIALATRINCAEAAEQEVVGEVRLVGRPRSARGIRRLVLTLAHQIDPWLRKAGFATPQLPLVTDLLLSRRLRALLHSADVIDLQWEQNIRLLPLLRRLAPHARFTGMFHDVLGQVYRGRLEAAAPGFPRFWARVQHRYNGLLESAIAPRLDTAFVLSVKDSLELTAAAPSAQPVVVTPPIISSDTPMHYVGDREPVVGFISALARLENREAAQLLISGIWPRVRRALPCARLVVIGGGLDEQTATEWGCVPGVEIAGFVDDLEEAYSWMSVCAAPLKTGAGVKFKMLEALARGIPTVTTPVGAEGIDPTWFWAISDDEEEQADAIIRALSDPRAANEARRQAPAIRQSYGVERMQETYLAALEGWPTG